MTILQICSKIPFPPRDGGSIAMNSLTDGLIECGNKVKVLAINTPKHFIKEDNLDIEYRKRTDFQSVFIDTSINYFSAFLNLFTKKSYNIIRFQSSKFEKTLVDILINHRFDIIQLESLFLSSYIPIIRKHSKSKIVLRSHNVEYVIWERLAAETTNPLKKKYLNLLAGRLKQYEISMLNKYDGIATITKNDAASFLNLGCKLPLITIPFGIDISDYPEEKTSSEFPSVFHIGAMDWMPNADGIKWFLENVWLKVIINHPTLNLYLAGRNMPDWLKELSMKNVIVIGEVDDSIKFIMSHSIMLVPLNSGGGMRIKIIEGMALGKTIISTSIGAEGIECTNGKNIIIANSTDEFVDAINKCISNKSYSQMIANNARLFVQNNYDNIKICTELTQYYKRLINEN